jgi:hypothetical protein
MISPLSHREEEEITEKSGKSSKSGKKGGSSNVMLSHSIEYILHCQIPSLNLAILASCAVYCSGIVTFCSLIQHQ